VTAIVVYACAYKRIPILLKLVSLLIFDRPIFLTHIILVKWTNTLI